MITDGPSEPPDMVESKEKPAARSRQQSPVKPLREREKPEEDEYESEDSLEENTIREAPLPSGMASIDMLPDEVIVKIMSFLSLADRLNTRLVSRRWHEISYDPILIRNDYVTIMIPITPEEEEEWAKKSFKDFDQYSSVFRQVNFELFSLTTPLMKSPFWSLHGKTIKTLSFSDCNSTEMACLLRNCPNLEDLTLDCNEKRLVSQFTEPIPTIVLPNLEFLHLKNFPYLEGINIVHALLAGVTNLSILWLSSLKMNSEDWSRLIAFLELNKHSLNKLFLYNLNLTDKIFEDIVEIVESRLILLEISNCKLTDSSLRTIGCRLKHLKHILIRVCYDISTRVPNFSRDAIAITAMLKCLLNLTSLSLRNCQLGGGLFSMSKAICNLPNLTKLDLSYTSFSPESLVAAFGTKDHPELTHLCLDRFMEIDCDVLCDICPNLPNLQYLSLIDCHRIRDRGFEAILMYSKKLQGLMVDAELQDSTFMKIAMSEVIIFHLGRMNRTVFKEKSTSDILALLERCPNLMDLSPLQGYDQAVWTIIKARRAARPFAIDDVSSNFTI